ncbi:MAG: HepT-like ribonuclease domain-containing protein [Solirubrobacteraceae bacterium]
MTTVQPIAAPLEANDPERARALKAKIRDRVSDVRRHLLALRAAMAEFGDDFDLDAFSEAYASENPVELNRVKAVERGVDQLYNYVAELAAFGLELAELRRRREETNARRDLDALCEGGVLSGELTSRLQRLRELRRMLVHEYATATAEQVHESAKLVADNFTAFYNAYREWIKRGFAPAGR